MYEAYVLQAISRSIFGSNTLGTAQTPALEHDWSSSEGPVCSRAVCGLRRQSVALAQRRRRSKVSFVKQLHTVVSVALHLQLKHTHTQILAGVKWPLFEKGDSLRNLKMYSLTHYHCIFSHGGTEISWQVIFNVTAFFVLHCFWSSMALLPITISFRWWFRGYSRLTSIGTCQTHLFAETRPSGYKINGFKHTIHVYMRTIFQSYPQITYG